METIVGEKVKVGAVFDTKMINPRWFIYRNVRREIKEVNYRWKSRTGETMVSYFSVSDGSASYLLSFNHTTLEWTLEKIYAG